MIYFTQYKFMILKDRFLPLLCNICIIEAQLPLSLLSSSCHRLLADIIYTHHEIGIKNERLFRVRGLSPQSSGLLWKNIWVEHHSTGTRMWFVVPFVLCPRPFAQKLSPIGTRFVKIRWPSASRSGVQPGHWLVLCDMTIDHRRYRSFI